MLLTKLVFKNLLHKPLGALLSVVLLMFGVGIIALLMTMQRQLEGKLENDLRDIDMVLGAKGSPLQLVLSAVYHVDAPTGNIPFSEVKQIAQSPMIKGMIPLAYGDSYRSFRILGADTAYVSKYEGRLANGRLYQTDFEAVIGAKAAAQTGLNVGQSFAGTHGEAAEGEAHAEHPYKVVGILSPSNSVLDQLILTNLHTVVAVHKHPEEETEEEAGHHEHEHDGEHAHEGEHKEMMDSIPEITAALLKFRSPMALMSLPRMVNANTSMQAVIPSLEINRLLSLMGVGAATFRAVAGGVMVMAGFSVFVALFSRLRDRRYELALMRSMGCSRRRLFFLLLAEGFVLALAGFVLGWLLSRAALSLIGSTAGRDFHLSFDAAPTAADGWLLLATLGVGIFAALIPALKAWNLNISTTLADA